jgi:hypothetical protein
VEPSLETRAEGSAAAAVALVVMLALLGGAGALASLPHAVTGDEPVAIVFPFWLGRAEAIEQSFAAGDRVLRTGRLSSIVVVAPRPDDAPLPRGAWLSLKLAGLAGCLDGAAAPGERP